MTTLLAGDIGGTKTILSLMEATPAPNPDNDSFALPQLKPLFQKTFSSRAYPDLVPMVQEFLAAAADAADANGKPEAACFGIAGPVVDNTSELTNLGWFLQADSLAHELDIPNISLINDFSATGYGVLGLQDDDLEVLQAAEAVQQAPIAIIGAGTGLGQGFLIPQSTGYQVYASEGGHADFAPRSELEFQLSRYLLDRYRIDRVSAERVISGMGIAAIYQFLRDRTPERETPEMEEIYRAWEHQIGQSDKTIDLSAEVSKAAQAGTDPLCQEAMNVFVDAYGAEAGNLALKLLPYGGLYVAGGIAAKILPLLKSGRFLAAFARKGRVSPLLKKVPVYVVLNSDVGLIGAGLYAARSLHSHSLR